MSTADSGKPNHQNDNRDSAFLKSSCLQILIPCFIVGFLVLGVFIVDGLIRQAKTKKLNGIPVEGQLYEKLTLTGKVRPDVFHLNEMYELTIANHTGQDLHHPKIEVNGVEQPLPKFEDYFPNGDSCELFFNHDWSNLKEGWSKPRDDGNLFPTSMKFRCDEFSGEWKIDIVQP